MIAFATLGCPGLPLDDVIDLAVRHGCTGVEFRYAEGEPVHPGLTDAELAVVGRRLADAGVTPVALDSYVRVATGEASDEAVVADLRRHVRAAAALGAAFVRVFPGGSGSGTAGGDPAGAGSSARYTP
ncbi:MAG: TIM barrel protein, partial [Actinocatenispora sp.]